MFTAFDAWKLESEHMKRDLESKVFIQIDTLLPVIEEDHHHISHDEHQKLQKDNAQVSKYLTVQNMPILYGG